MAQGIMEVQLSPAQYNGGYHISCHGGSNGKVNTIIIGGTAPFTFNWSNATTTQLISQITAGTYTVTVTQSGGSIATASITIREPSALDPALYSQTYEGGTNISLGGGSDGSIELTNQSGTPPYEYVWSNSSQEQNLYDLIAGAYTVTVTDANGCTVTRSITLTEPIPLTISNITSPTFNGYHIHCNGGHDGTINLTIAGGIPPYNISWNNGSFEEDPTGLAAGDYSVRVVDQNRTQVEASITLTEPPALTLELIPFVYANNYNISLFGGFDGSITTSTGGGVLPYSYLWNDGSSSQNRTTLNHGTKVLTVTDANGCTITSEVMLLEPASSDWMMKGNANTDTAVQFIGTTDSTDFIFRTNNQEHLRLNADGSLKIKNLESNNIGLDLVFVDQQGILQKKPPCSVVLQRTEPWILGGNFIIPNPPNVSGTDQLIGTCTDHNFVMISNAIERMRFTHDGNIGIGTINPQNLLDINGSMAIGSGYAGNNLAPPNGLIVEGNVGIGTTSVPQGFKLVVNGNIIAEKVRVKLYNVWPDNVFENKFELLSPDELENFIHKNKHLPDVPTAIEVNKNGHDLGEMDAILLKKIEELTLYMLAQQKVIKELEAKIK